MEQTMSERSKSRSRSRSPLVNKDPIVKKEAIVNKDPLEKKEEDDDDRYLFIENLPPFMNFIHINATLKSFKDHEKFTNDIVFIHKVKGCGEGFKGKCVIEFKTSEACDNAVEILQSVKVEGRDLYLIPGAKDRMMKVKRKTLRMYGEFEGNKVWTKKTDQQPDELNNKPVITQKKNIPDVAYKNHELYGLSVKFLKELGVYPPFPNRVFVGNLHESVTATKLREVFSMAGQVLSVVVTISPTRNNMASARIMFDHPVEAIQAISMFHKKDLFKRTMKVKLDFIKNKIVVPEGLSDVGMGLGPDGQPMTGVRYTVELEPLKNLLMKELKKLQEFNKSNDTPFKQNNSEDQNKMINLMQMLQQNFAGPLNTALQQFMTGQNAAMGNMLGQSAGAIQNMEQSVYGQTAANQIAFVNQSQPAFGQNMVNQTAFANQSQPPSRFDVPPSLPQAVVNQNELLQQWAYQVPWQAQPTTSRFDMPPSGVQATVPNAGQSWMSGWGASTQTTQPAANGNVKPAYESAPKHNDVKKPEGKTFDMLLFTNLPASVTSQALVNKMSEVGPLKLAEITGQGRAVVKFQKSEDADKCLKLYDRSKVDGQEITVKYV